MWVHVVLPVIEAVEWEGFEEDRQAESDVWEEERALSRSGWSETNWRQWMAVLQQEVARRRAWWDGMQSWSRRLGVGLGGETACQERAWQAMVRWH